MPGSYYERQAPADAGLDRTVEVARDGAQLLPTIQDPTHLPPDNRRAHVRLDGRESNDSGGRPISYRWSVVSRPALSTLGLLSDGLTAFPSFVPDRSGSYLFELIMNNGVYDSGPSRVSILVNDSNAPPTAIAFVEDLAALRSGSVERPLLDFRPGDRVVLNGSQSTDSDLSHRGKLTYRWTQLLGETVALEPRDTSPTISFVPPAVARLGFRLTVSDLLGASDWTDLEVLVRDSQTLPTVRIVSSSSTTSETGEDFGEGFAVTTNPRSLRTTVPATVTLTGRIKGTSPGRRFDHVWNQIAGPIVVLSSDGSRNTLDVESVVCFTPTTSRVHMFEWLVYPLTSTGERLGGSLRRFVRVVIDTDSSSVPQPGGQVTPAVIPLAGTSTNRTFTLDADGSVLLVLCARPALLLQRHHRTLGRSPAG